MCSFKIQCYLFGDRTPPTTASKPSRAPADTQETAPPTARAGGKEGKGGGTEAAGVVGVAQETVDPMVAYPLEQKGVEHTAIVLHVDESDSPRTGLLSTETTSV